MAGPQIREPIRRPWIWIVLAVLMLVSIPWYLPPGSVAFVWFGVPMWMLISIVGTLGMCAYVSWLCFTQWDLVEAEEERTQDGADLPGAEG